MATYPTLPFDETRWIIRIRRIFDEEIKLNEDQPICIFDVPKPLLGTKPEAYIPQMVALGPYHHRREELCHMEYKLSAAKRAQSHLTGMDFQQLVDLFTKLELLIRAHYHRHLNLSNETLGWMMAIEISFLLEFLQTFMEDNIQRALQRIPFKMSYLVDPSRRTSSHDMLLRGIVMLENQIPLLLLLKAIETRCCSSAQSVLSSMLVGLHLPVIGVDVNSEVVLLNLVAYEAEASSGGPLVLARYVELMNGIVDARLLRECGVILNHLKSDREVAELWNGMTRSVRMTRVPSHYGSCWK
ncbi:hypothetical protein U9M48_001864, partial [Paspalum notatum var. saurae]